ncbi:LptF/LptG family permease [Pannus brasiliensis CCIBt3594]|uniref:LptF/LptG family permease n=1 Tax=Pannus brasiliensis CCIBt3594 TaxID=1427578 RepID=A0AAW9QU70_9CHRO
MKAGNLQARFSNIPGLSLLDRYIFTELILPWLFGMGLFSSLGVAIGTLFDLVRRVTESGLPLTLALKILVLKMPEFIVLAFPMSMLLAALMAYSRLASDSEIIAFKSIGINAYRLVIPAVILSLVVTGLTYLFNDYVAPAASYEANAALTKALRPNRKAFIEDNIIYPEYGQIRQEDGSDRTVLRRLFYAERFNGERMEGLTILDRTQPEVNQIITSESAAWNIERNIWDFYNGTVYLIAPDGSYRNIVRFQHQQLALPSAPLDLAFRARSGTEMTLRQARDYLKILRLSGNPTRVRKLEVQIEQKIALPFVCLVFGLIGAAIGLRPQNANKATSFGICIVLIFAYYLLSFVTTSLGVAGALSPVMAAWLPNLLGLTAGGVLLSRSAR